MLGVMAIKVADPVGSFLVATLAKIVLDGYGRGPMGLLRHDLLVAHDTGRGVILGAQQCGHDVQ